MFCILLLTIIISLILCKNNNLELFSNFKNKFININCENSKNLNKKINCIKNSYCLRERDCKNTNYCGNNNLFNDALILNNSDKDNDINNRRLSNHHFSSIEINSDFNKNTWC